MAIKLGSTNINGLYLGSTAINKAYLGSVEVFTTTGAFTPADLFASGEEGVWYQPSPSTCFTDTGGTTAASVGDPVARINDSSGNGNHATQATLASRPILRQTGGGLYYLEFDGADDNLDFPELNIVDGQSVFFGFEPNAEITNATSASYVLLPATTDVSDLRGILGFGTTTGTLTNERIAWITVSSGNVFGSGYTSANISAAPHVFSLNFGNAVSSTTLKIDGASVTLSDCTTGGFNATLSAQRYARLGAGSLTGNLYSLIIRGATTAGTDLTDTESYVADKSGVTL